MKKLTALLLTAATAMSLSGCFGYASKDNELLGQPKKLHNNTPIVCTDYTSVDVSLGVMVNGVGSMSTDDKTFLVADKAIKDTLNAIINDGGIALI